MASTVPQVGLRKFGAGPKVEESRGIGKSRWQKVSWEGEREVAESANCGSSAGAQPPALTRSTPDASAMNYADRSVDWPVITLAR